MSEGADFAAFAQAVEHHRAGRLEAAESLYRKVLPTDSRHADALHLSGVAALQLGRFDEALELITQAVHERPQAAAYQISLGQVHAAASRFDDSIAAYQQATVLSPQLPDAWFGLGVVLQAANRQQEAIDVYRRLLRIEPDHADACHNLATALELTVHIDEAISLYGRALELEPTRAGTQNNLASALFRVGRFEEAITAGRQALALEPDSAMACNNLGCALTAARRLSDAVDVLRRAIALHPEFAEAWYNLANALREQGKFAEAAAACRRALALTPDRAETHVNLGNILQAQRQFEEAIACYRRALELKPSDVEAYSNLGNALRSSGQLDPAIAAFRTCLSLRPDFHAAYCNLGNALKDTGQIEQAIECFRSAVELCPADSISHSNLAYSVYYHPNYDSATILAENRRWNAAHTANLDRAFSAHKNDRDPDRRLRIGYVGSDFREHCQSLFTIPLLSQHDRNRFEIFCYANVARPDAFTERIRKLVDCWRDTAGRNDDDIARQVRTDEIDILVDLTMHMSNGRPLLIARRPAPVQVAYLAYPGTTGLTSIDYRLTDPYLDPLGETDADYVERSIRLPETFWCYDALTEQPVPNSLPANRGGYVTFGCLNNFCKVTDRTLVLWARVLRAVENSRLLLLAPAVEHRARILNHFQEASVEPSRVEFLEHRPRPKYLELYHRIDVCLDTLPYNGHTTSLDSLWMGVPVVTCVGRTVVGRAGYSQLSNLGLSQLVAWSDGQFVSIATELARDRARLAQLRSTLRERMEQSPLMDADRFARNVEAAFRQMWRRWCQDGQTIQMNS
jgi:protein O-GlcNAc transferase